eukprot:gene10930-12091_t
MATKIGNVDARKKGNRPYLLSKLEEFKDTVNMACFVPHEDAVITVASDKSVRVWIKRETGQYWPSICHFMPAACTSLFFHGTSTKLFIGMGNGKISEMKLSPDLNRLTPERDYLGTPSNFSQTKQFDPDAKYVFVGDFSGQISVLSLNQQEKTLTLVTTLKGHSGMNKVKGLCYASQAKKLFSAGEDQSLVIWDMKTKRDETPTWSQSDICEKCSQPFFWNFKHMMEKKVMGVRQHHCRRCGRAVCSKCSESSSPLPMLGFEFKVRLCDECHGALVERDQTSLATFHDTKHSITYLSMDLTKGRLLSCGADKVVKIWDIRSILFDAR